MKGCLVIIVEGRDHLPKGEDVTGCGNLCTTASERNDLNLGYPFLFVSTYLRHIDLRPREKAPNSAPYVI